MLDKYLIIAYNTVIKEVFAVRSSGAAFKYDDVMQRQIVCDYENSRLSRREIAAKYGIGISTVDAYRRRWGKGEPVAEAIG